MQSDRSFTGRPLQLGPYNLSIAIREDGAVGPALYLAGGIHAQLNPDLIVDGELAKANSDAYHGGTTSDELAALVGLELGVRLRLAGTLRLSGLHEFRDHDLDARFETPRLTRPGTPGIEFVPRAMTRPTNLGAVVRLSSLPSIGAKEEVELVRAARSYASALWWANEDPNQAWLGFVTALEIAAKQRRTSNSNSDTELLAEHWPEMWNALDGTTAEVKEKVARRLASLVRSKQAFVNLIADLAPSPPEARPTYGELDWNEMGTHASTIYNHRSALLHGGKPFPPPMLERPRFPDQEAPLGITMGSHGGIWDAQENPMLLATFEYICRGILLNWWDELIESSSRAG